MLIKLLPNLDKKLLLDVVELLALSDNSVLWDGKKHDEITSNTDLNNLSIQIDEQENELITDLKYSAGLPNYCNSTSVESRLVEQLKNFALNKVELAETRLAAAQVVLNQLLEERSSSLRSARSDFSRGLGLYASQSALGRDIEFSTNRPKERSKSRPEDPKIMLFEMFLVALRDGVISSIEQELLKAFQRHYQLEDFMFDELLERAEALNTEISKTIALVLE